MPNHDIFLSHASEDNDIARPLAQALKEKGFDVWYDENELTIIDPVRTEIDKALKNSRCGVVILSKDYFNKPWPRNELEALIALGIPISPIRHMTYDQIVEASPSLVETLGNRIEISTDQSIDEIAKCIAQGLKKMGIDPPATPNRNVKSSDQVEIRLSGFIQRKKSVVVLGVAAILILFVFLTGIVSLDQATKWISPKNSNPVSSMPTDTIQPKGSHPTGTKTMPITRIVRFKEKLNMAKAMFDLEKFEESAHSFFEASQYADPEKMDSLYLAKNWYKQKAYEEAAKEFNRQFLKFYEK